MWRGSVNNTPNVVPLNTVIVPPKVILNKTSRHNTVLKNLIISSRRKKRLWKEFDTAWFRIRLTRVSHSPPNDRG